jgi:hypothetical protein
MSTQPKRNRFLNAKRDGNSFTLMPEAQSQHAAANEESNHEKAGSVIMRRSKRLDRQHILARSDVFLHDLPPRTLELLRRAADQGLVPSGLDFGGDANSIVVLRLSRPFKSGVLNRLTADEEMIRHVALELVRLGREVPEASWHEGAEDYAIALVRRLVEVARDER